MLRLVLSKARFHQLLRFTRKKDRAAAGAFFVEGWSWLEEALSLVPPPLCVLAAHGVVRSTDEAALLDRARAIAKEFHEIDAAQLARLTESVTAPGVAALVSWAPVGLDAMLRALERDGPALVVVLDGVGDPGNAGTIVRTADWFGASAVVFGGGSVEPANPKCVRATMGSLFHLPIATEDALAAALGRLRASGFVSVGAALEGDDLRDIAWPERVALVVGNEAGGIRPEVRASLARQVRISSFGRAESLNAAVAAAVLMHDWRRVRAGGS